MNKKLVFTILVVVILVIIIVVWKSAYSSSTIDQVSTPTQTDSQKLSVQTVSEKMSNKTREELMQEELIKQLQDFQTKSGNITQFLNQFKASCVLENCDAALQDALNKYPDQKFAQLIRNLLKNLPIYEKQMQSIVLSTSISPQERFNQLWKLREQTLGKSEAKLGFEEERQYANYRFEYQHLMQNKQLSTEQRLKKFEDLQLQYIDVTKIDGNIAIYHQALMLLQQNQNSQQIQQLKNMLQDRYLSAEEKQEVQQQEQREERQHQQAEQYQHAVKQLQDDMQGLKNQLSEAEWNQRYQKQLEDLRLKMFS